MGPKETAVASAALEVAGPRRMRSVERAASALDTEEGGRAPCVRHFRASWRTGVLLQRTHSAHIAGGPINTRSWTVSHRKKLAALEFGNRTCCYGTHACIVLDEGNVGQQTLLARGMLDLRQDRRRHCLAPQTTDVQLAVNLVDGNLDSVRFARLPADRGDVDQPKARPIRIACAIFTV